MKTGWKIVAGLLALSIVLLALALLAEANIFEQGGQFGEVDCNLTNNTSPALLLGPGFVRALLAGSFCAACAALIIGIVIGAKTKY